MHLPEELVAADDDETHEGGELVYEAAGIPI
jgi:hypothetical protein